MRQTYSWGLGNGITCIVEICGPEKTELDERNVLLMAKHVELLRQAVQLDEIGIVLDERPVRVEEIARRIGLTSSDPEADKP